MSAFNCPHSSVHRSANPGGPGTPIGRDFGGRIPPARGLVLIRPGVRSRECAMDDRHFSRVQSELSSASKNLHALKYPLSRNPSVDTFGASVYVVHRYLRRSQIDRSVQKSFRESQRPRQRQAEKQILRSVICAMRGPTLTSTFFHLAMNHRPLKMNRNIALATVVVVLALSSTAYAELVHWTSCPPSSPEKQQLCTVHDVHVDPCREAEERKPCSIKRGRNATIRFDYTPEFSGSLFSRPYWASEIMDLPFLGMPLDACTSTVCPASSGQKQSYSVVLPISKKFPARTYDLKWKLWNDQEQECCFMFQIKLVK